MIEVQNNIEKDENMKRMLPAAAQRLSRSMFSANFGGAAHLKTRTYLRWTRIFLETLPWGPVLWYHKGTGRQRMGNAVTIP